ncbi:hypothetical protein QC761_0065270 [Podospora bellae-mahoneyi]|uniref:Uncharacterized protein n=1 Tax=Podospora bellae-mahoneyi TaxID=2093777 RepID=A0ABR0FJP2_9PEZI|nr:hypothetical protein QC761_0065270 [Podospora bellae-mahoneyi]
MGLDNFRARDTDPESPPTSGGVSFYQSPTPRDIIPPSPSRRLNSSRRVTYSARHRHIYSIALSVAHDIRRLCLDDDGTVT